MKITLSALKVFTSMILGVDIVNVISWSGGKDSTATVILAHLHNIPVDRIIFSEVMFDKDISGELPEHIEFVHRAKEVFEDWGYRVDILHSDVTYLDCFFSVNKGSRTPERKGMLYGFPMALGCIINGQCKMKPIRAFTRANPDAFYFVGIASDELLRLQRMKSNCRSLLNDFGYTELMAYDLCREFDLLSPIYSFSFRGGCWFCPNARSNELQHLREHYRSLYDKLLSLEKVPNKCGYCFNILHKFSLLDFEEEMKERDYFISLLDRPIERGGAS